MTPIARSLGSADRREVAQYYAAREVPESRKEGAPASRDDQLALHGRWSDDLPVCVQCHGERGVGIGDAFPPLAGQPSAYLAAQLRAWQQGTRQGEPLNLMKVIAGRLTEADIRGVSDFFGVGPQGTGTRETAPAAVAEKPRPSPVKRPAPVPSNPGGSPFRPADVPIPNDEFGKVVQRGREIFDDPERYASQYTGNALRCTSCHLDEGRRVGSAPMWAAYVSYPAFRAKNGHVNTFAERLQGCFRYSMNGRAPPLGDPVLVALETYSYWMARGAPVDPKISGRGYIKVPNAALAPDRSRGALLYEQKCALCHGSSGAGHRDNDDSPGFPALWGADSYNWGAGMVNVSNAAAFIKSNMPFGLGGTLTDQEAWDVALFVDSHERPQDPRFAGSVQATRARFHDSDDSLYGQDVDGYILGSKSVPPGHRIHERPSGGESR